MIYRYRQYKDKIIPILANQAGRNLKNKKKMEKYNK